MAHITPGQGTVGVGVGAGSGANIEPTAAAIVLSTRVTGDTNDRFTIGADGKQSWGPGNGAPDTFLYRGTAGRIKTDGQFLVVGRIYAGNGNWSLDDPTTAAGATSFGGNMSFGTGAPQAGNGSNGDIYFRYDTPGVSLQRIYQKSAGAWVGIV